MNPLVEYAHDYADALGREFERALSGVTMEEVSVREDTDVTMPLVTARADSETISTRLGEGLNVAVREFATQHGFEYHATADSGTIVYEMYPSPSIDFLTDVPKTAN